MQERTRVEGQGRLQKRAAPAREGVGMVVLRVWMWLVPVVMLVASLAFSMIAALDGRWGLMVLMVIGVLFATGLLLLHWWLMYRFGNAER